MDSTRRQAVFDHARARIATRMRRVEPRATKRAFMLTLLSGAERKKAAWRVAAGSGGWRP
jgi:hypothetical protein